MNLLSISAHNSHQTCVCVVPPEDGQKCPKHVETVNLNKVKSEVCIKLVLLITKLIQIVGSGVDAVIATALFDLVQKLSPKAN
jgi:hypothetical protein